MKKKFLTVALLVIALTISICSTVTANDERAVVLVNSASQYFSDFQHYIGPYLDNFGIPYTVLDIANNSIHQDIADRALIIIGHNGLDKSGMYLDEVEQSYITNAVFNGTGLVSFDNLLVNTGYVPRYQYVQDILGLTYYPNISANTIGFVGGSQEGSYISEGHDAGEIINLKANMTSLGMTPPQDAQVIATTGGNPFIVVRGYGQGKAVQWGSYAFTDAGVQGYVYKLDDLVWRSLVWAARKPFALQGMPPFVTFRVDDCTGPFWWAEDAVAQGFKPWIGFYLDDMDDTDTTQLATLVNSGNATAAIHAFDYGTCFYYNHSAQSDYTDGEIAAHFAEGTQWHQQHNIPISKFVVPHQYEFGTNVFSGLASWGVEFVGTPLPPGNSETPFSCLQMGPYRKYDSGNCEYSDPFYYADYLSIPGHPEYEGRFFNVLTEIRDNAGYEWYPDNDVSGSIERGVSQLKRAFDSMALPTLFTHEVGSIQSISRSNWNSILSGIVDGVASYHPIYTTMDSAARYVRALADSNISQIDFDPSTDTLTTTLDGETDVPTQFYLFTEQPAADGSVIVKHSINVPVFSGSTQIVTQVNSQPSISFSPASLSATTTLGNNAPSQSFQVWNFGGATLSYTISDNATWLSCTPTSGTSTDEQDTITVNYATSGLSAGTYTATITITAAGATNSPQTIPVSLNVVNPVSVLVWLEGESGSLTSPMAVGPDSQASSGAYVWIPEGSGDILDNPSQAVGAAAYTFSVPVAGDYVVWGRLIDNLGNSFFVSMDSGAYALWDTAGGSTWGWDLVNNQDVADPLVYSLGTGQHTLVIRHREDGTKLDRILITNDRTYVPQGQGEVIPSAPWIMSTPVTSAVVGQPYTYDVNATGVPSPTYSLLGTPPPTMTIDSTTGLIQWTPSAAGDVSVTVRASNGVGTPADQGFTIHVDASVAPTITTTPVTTVYVGKPYQYDVNATGYPAPTYSLLDGYPVGMTIDSTTGLIQWTPSAAGDVSVTVRASNVAGYNDQPFTISVAVVPPLPAGMIHYWKLDELSSPYKDLYGIDNATCTNCPTATTGIIGGAQEFAGTNQVSAADDNTFDWGATDSFSIEFWMKTDAASTCSGDQAIVGRSDGATPLQWWVGCSDGGAAAFVLKDKNGDIAILNGSTDLTDGQWHHIVAVRDAGTNKVRLYVDAVEEASVDKVYTGGFDSTTAALNIGWLDRDTGYHFVGAVDETALYDRPLSGVEISQHYTNGQGGNGYTYGLSVKKIGPTTEYYSALQLAYSSASGGDTVLSQAMPFNEDLVFDLDMIVTLAGGYDDSWSFHSDYYTTVTGSLSIGKGTVTVGNLVIQ